MVPLYIRLLFKQFDRLVLRHIAIIDEDLHKKHMGNEEQLEPILSKSVNMIQNVEREPIQASQNTHYSDLVLEDTPPHELRYLFLSKGFNTSTK